MQINLEFDASVANAPAGFTTAVQAAASSLDTLLIDPITVNIAVGYDEIGGYQGSSGTPITVSGEGLGGPVAGTDIGYAQFTQELAAHLTSAAQAEELANLPSVDPTGGGDIYLSPAEEKAWGMLPADGTAIDGNVGFSTDSFDNFDPNDRNDPSAVDFIGIAEHELTHALGRLAFNADDPSIYSVLDLTRYASAGVLASQSTPAPYFSIDGGNTNLNVYDADNGSDPADWAGNTPDSFDAESVFGTENPVTPVDMTLLNVLGFAETTAPSTVTSFTAVNEADLNAALGTIRSGLTDTTYNITLAGPIALNTAMLQVTLPSGDTLVLNGQGQTIDGGGTQGGFVVNSGYLVLQNLTIARTIVAGGNGSTGAGGGGGGAGVGGGLFIDAGATVAIEGVVFNGDAAAGGAGGNAENFYAGGDGGGPDGSKVTNGASLAAQSGGSGGEFEGGGGGNQYLSATAGVGGAGGFGGGGGGGGYYQVGTAGLGGAGGFGGGNGGATAPSSPSFGGAGGGGGGGLGAGGDIFVDPGGELVMASGTLSGGTVTGGPGGSGGTPGGNGTAAGSGIFLGGSTGALFDPAPGQTVDVPDSIADQSGAGGTGANAANGYVFATGGGLVRLGAANSYTSNTILEGGVTVDLALDGAAGTGQIDFAGPGTLRIEPGVIVTIPINALRAGCTVDLGGVTNGAMPATLGFDPASDILTVTGSVGGARSLRLNSAGADDAGNFHAGIDAAGNGTAITYVACFAAGTRIRTATGATAVERLRAGSLVRTLQGGLARVEWLGHRRADCRRHPRPHDVWPVRIAAGAFAAGVPGADLWLSPDHGVYVENVLIPVRYLINGATVAQVPMDRVVYWHVELERHDIVLAEGLACESYLDTGNRSAFENGGAVIEAHPDFARHVWAERACAEIVLEGPRLTAVRAALLARTRALGHFTTGDAVPRLRVDGTIVPPRKHGSAIEFTLPAGAGEVWLLSRSGSPADHDPGSSDRRCLGLALRRLAVSDGGAKTRFVALDDPGLAEGFHAPERDGAAVWRWTTGAARLAPSLWAGRLGHVTLRLVVADWQRYWLPPRRGKQSNAGARSGGRAGGGAGSVRG